MSYDIRQSQVIHTWPAGAMIDFPEISLIMLCHDDSPNDWGLSDNGHDDPNQKKIISDNRLAEAFKVDYFVVPPVMDGVSNLPAWTVRFPKAHYCPKCGMIHIINRDMGRQRNPMGKLYDEAMTAFHCTHCFDNQRGVGPKLVPMRFVIATEEGFIDDFPWDWYVHKSKPEERNRGHRLFYQSKGGSASLSDIIIESRGANDSIIAKRDLGQIFDQEIFTEPCSLHGHYLNYVKGYMPKPWKGWHNNTEFNSELISDIPGQSSLMNGEDLSPEAKRKFPRTMQRGAGNIIFPIIYSGILLPTSAYEQQCPPDVQKIIENAILSLKDNIPDIYLDYSNDQWREFFISQVNSKPSHQLNRLTYQPSEINGFIRNYFGDNPSEQFINKSGLLRRQEFKAFTSNEILNDELIWFKKRKVSGSAYNEALGDKILEEVVLLEKISALKVFRGFTRVKPLMNEDLVFADGADNLDTNQLKEFQRIQDARKNQLHTKELPAVEVRGEGIFIKFSNDQLNQWSDVYPDIRLNTINDNLQQSNLDFNQNHQLITKRYLFLHTFSHILLKELAEDCGYSLSSLSEIIYCSQDTEMGTNNEMNGILIYTTTSDSEGSLGGLVEKGNPNYLSSVIQKGVDKARWCSSDPLCITAEHGQGFMGLNLAACYSCVLLPETSCEKMNKYLDRAAVIGKLNKPEIGFFK